MSDQHKIEILRILSEDAVEGKAVRYSFNTLSKNMGLTKDKIDVYLTELLKAPVLLRLPPWQMFGKKNT